MPSNAMRHLNGHVMCVVDTETSGLIAGHHDLIQVCVLPIDAKLEVRRDIVPFYTGLQLKRPENIDPELKIGSKMKLAEAQTNGLDPYRAADFFEEWFEKLKLPPGKRIIPLAHNWPFDRAFLVDWLGNENFNQFFDSRYRDSMVSANFCNDRADFMNEPYPYPKVNLSYLAAVLKIPHERAHDALGDCVVTLETYKRMIRGF